MNQETDFGSVSEAAVEPRELNSVQRLSLAKGILGACSLIFCLAAVAYLFSPVEGKVIFELTSHTTPPIVTLVIGYYFGKT